MNNAEQGYEDGLLDKGWNAVELSGKERDAYTSGWYRGVRDRAMIQQQQ